ncbi:hypothetical protein MMYC01_204227 [Madurella mycetomatis]|uniref:Uncharacterized protein n=1 Tax=Madurella mycetomatis TaxID=100816 RepID=A0A175W954_9PEZI|nr:hypothetical protein MMYC01_204227 [Madurella mycetomatis]
MPNILPPRVFAAPRGSVDSDSDWDTFNPGGRTQSSELLAPKRLHGGRDQGAVWQNPSSGVVQTPQHKNSVGPLVDYLVTEDPSRSFPPYYSISRHNRDRNVRSSSKTVSGNCGSYAQSYKLDRATAYAIKTARYPLLYEKLKTPGAAKKALRTWKKDGKAVVVEGTNDGLLIQGAKNATGDSSGSKNDNDAGRDDTGTENITLQDFAQNNIHHNEAPDGSGKAGGSRNIKSLAPASTAPSTAMAVRGTIPTAQLPAQHMTFSEPILEKTRRGNRLHITCNLGQSYPNFHIECRYIYVDESETINLSHTDTRLSFAAISTRENMWVVAMEKKGYNEAFITGFVGGAEYDRLDRQGNEPVKGYHKSIPLTGAVAKKIQIPDGFDLGGIWCKAVGFYQMNLFVPAHDYRVKE